MGACSLLVVVGLFKKTSQVREIDIVCDFKINYSKMKLQLLSLASI